MAQSPTLYPDLNETSLVWTVGRRRISGPGGGDPIENAAGERCRDTISKLLFLHFLMDCKLKFFHIAQLIVCQIAFFSSFTTPNSCHYYCHMIQVWVQSHPVCSVIAFYLVKEKLFAKIYSSWFGCRSWLLYLLDFFCEPDHRQRITKW